MRGLLIALCVALACLAVSGCEQWSARVFGGSMRFDLPCNEKLLNATWKDGASAREIVYWNDEGSIKASETPEERWQRMRAWLVSKIKSEAADAKT